MSSIRWRARGRVVSWPDRPNGVPSYPAPPHLAAPPCAAPSRPARSVSGFWIRQVGLHRISLIRASGESFRRRVFDALGGTRKACLLGEQFCWHPILPDPAPPPRRAPRPDPLVVCPSFRLHKIILVFNTQYAKNMTFRQKHECVQMHGNWTTENIVRLIPGLSVGRRLIPGHALHEKGLQRRKSNVPLVGSQEQRALLVPLINR